MNDKTSELLTEIKGLLKDIRHEVSGEGPSFGLMHMEIMVFLRDINYNIITCNSYQTIIFLKRILINRKGREMEYTWKLFVLVAFICACMGIVGSHILKKLQEILDKLGATNDLIRDGINKLNAIE